MSFFLLKKPNKLTPVTNSNFKQWIDMSSSANYTLNTTKVATAKDLSGFGNDYTASGTAQPSFSTTGLNNLPCMTANGSANVMTTTGTVVAANSSYTIQAVIINNNLSGDGIICAMGNMAIQSESATTRPIRIYHNGTTAISMKHMVQGTSYRIAAVYRAGSGATNIYINGDIVANIAPTVSNFTSGAMTLFQYLGSVYGAISLSELLVYDTALAPSDITSNDNYLAWKWGFAPAIYSGYDVFVSGGQSNDVGVNSGGLDPSTTTDQVVDGIYQLGRTDPNNYVRMACFDPLQSVGNEISGAVSHHLEFAKQYKANKLAADRAILLVPCGKGSTGFGSNDWNPGNALYEDMIARATYALTNFPNAVLKGFNWHQGENDSTMTQSQYETARNAMIADFRSRVPGAYSIPFTCGMLSTVSYNGSGPQAAIQAVASTVAHSAYADSTGLSLNSDNIHFTAASQRSFGDLYYTAWASIT